MASLRRLPPGRSGRLWLRRRRQIAERSVGLLDRKLQILRGEQQRAHLIERRARREWERLAAQARTWFVRAAILGGQRDLSFSMPPVPATVEVTWGAVMGLVFPADARCHLPGPQPGDRSPANAALGPAIAAHQSALQAAAAQAVAGAACRIIDAEVLEVKRRLSALKRRWLPLMEIAASQLESRLEETERSEMARLRAFALQSKKEGWQ